MQSSRRRAACAACHVRKVRCDAATLGTPCSNCSKAGQTDCHLHVAGKRAPARYRSTAAVEVPIIAPAQHSRALDRPPLDPKSTPLLAGNKSTLDIGIAAEDHRTHLVEFIEQPSVASRSIDKDTRVTYVGTQVSNLSFLADAANPFNTSSHYASNRIARQHVSYEPDRLPAEALQLPEKAMVDRLLSAYFDHINPRFPVVDQHRFMAQYTARDSQNPPSLLLLQAILVVGAHVCYEGPERQTMKSVYFRRAKMLVDARFERNRDTVVQAALLLTWHTDGVDDVAANGWHWVQYAASVALGLGMHRDAEPSTLVAHNKRMWRRVFWLLFQCGVALAMQYGRPQAITLQDCDVHELSADDFTECGTAKTADYAIHKARLAVITSQALRDCFGPNNAPSRAHQALSGIDTKLAEWTMTLPKNLRPGSGMSLDVDTLLLHIDYNVLLLLLHRPIRGSVATRLAATREAANICSVAASQLQSLLESLRERGVLTAMSSDIVHTCFTALIHLSAEARSSNPIISTAARRRYESVLETLKQLREVWPEATPVWYYFDKKAQSLAQEAPAENNADATHDESLPMSSPAQRSVDWQDLFADGADTLLNDCSAWQDQYWEDVPGQPLGDLDFT
jgi:transcriptional regulatory protein AMDR